ncbi:hypothetical protein [Orenia marismortui]|uniref:Uncharacterized protein n=1 Tax=Orenia marismortui TaxID=46469 RepID=A0A4R8H0W3_9FIRM|nr:hypothetical protein [Orenia marismortui]TDX53158.1 hypothetical protein C7959_10310 [Orenia marismortui]
MNQISEIEMLIEKYQSKVNDPNLSKFSKLAYANMIRDLELFKKNILES